MKQWEEKTLSHVQESLLYIGRKNGYCYFGCDGIEDQKSQIDFPSIKEGQKFRVSKFRKKACPDELNSDGIADWEIQALSHIDISIDKIKAAELWDEIEDYKIAYSHIAGESNNSWHVFQFDLPCLHKYETISIDKEINKCAIKRIRQNGA